MSRLRVSDSDLDTFSRVAEATRAADLAIDQDRCDPGILTRPIASSWIAARPKATAIDPFGASLA